MTAGAPHRYRALRPDGRLELGTVEAEDRGAVSRLLSGRGLFPIEITEPDTARTGSATLPWADLALGLRLLANLLHAGLPLDRALAALGESAPPSWRAVLPSLGRRVREGASLGKALGEAGSGVPAILAFLIQAGEAGAGVAPAVERAADAAETVASTRAAIHQALVYPAILLTAGMLSLGFLALVVLPRFAAILAEMGQTLPVSTRVVLGVSVVAREALLPLSLGLVLCGVLWRAWTLQPAGRVVWHRFLLRLPRIGTARFALGTARAAGAIGALLETGVPLPRAFTLGAAASGDAALEAALLGARDRIIEGTPASKALAQTGALSPTAVRLARAGEEAGRLGAMLREAARLEQANAERLVRGAVQLIEPAFILFFGGLVGLVAAALLQALYGVRPA